MHSNGEVTFDFMLRQSEAQVRFPGFGGNISYIIIQSECMDSIFGEGIGYMFNQSECTTSIFRGAQVLRLPGLEFSLR